MYVIIPLIARVTFSLRFTYENFRAVRMRECRRLSRGRNLPLFWLSGRKRCITRTARYSSVAASLSWVHSSNVNAVFHRDAKGLTPSQPPTTRDPLIQKFFPMQLLYEPSLKREKKTENVGFASHEDYVRSA